MPAIGTPDLLSQSLLSRSLARVDKDLARAGRELTTGLRDDPVEATRGDPFILYRVERDLALNEAASATIGLARGRTETTQLALEKLQQSLSPLGAGVLGATSIGDLQGATTRAAGARDAFQSMVNALNSRFGDRSLFAGAATDGAAVAQAENILSDIAARAAGATDAAGVVAAVDGYFYTDPTGYADAGYLGSTRNADSAQLGEGESLDYALRADNDDIKAALSAVALAVIAGDPPAGIGADAQLDLLGQSAERAIAATDAVIELRGGLGVAEARVEEIFVRAEAERNLLTEARNRLVARDQFEAATEFNALEAQMQSILTITARLSNLTLTNFLR